MSSRIARAVLFLMTAAVSQALPPLTTIQDMLYKADGTRFNGIIVVSWSSFDAADASNITSQSLTVKVVDGNLRVQLVPTANSTPATYYTAKYNSDGKVQFQETWVVPTSATPVRVRDVRVATGTSSGVTAGNDATGSTPIQESDVTGLNADLSARPVKGSGYAPGRTVFANAQGALEAVSGAAGDCVHVDGTSGTCGSTTETLDLSFVDADTPAGIVDGSNRAFLLTASPNPTASLMLYRNGVLLKAGQDYSLAVQTVTFIPELTPAPGDTLLATYRTSVSETGTPAVYPSVQVLCSGVGATTNSTTLTSLGSCTIPSGVLSAGERVDIRFDLEHAGTSAGYAFELRWGAGTLFSRTAAATDTYVSARADAALSTDGALTSTTSWGTALAFAATAGKLTNTFTSGITVEIFGRMTSTTADTVALKSFTVTRLP